MTLSILPNFIKMLSRFYGKFAFHKAFLTCVILTLFSIDSIAGHSGSPTFFQDSDASVYVTRISKLLEIADQQIDLNIELAESKILAAEKLLKKVDNPLIKAQVYYAYGNLATEKECYQSAIINFKKSAGYYQLANDNVGQAKALNYLGVMYDYLGDYSKALQNYYTSLNLLKPENTEGLATAYNNIAVIHDLNGDKDKALINLMKAIEVSQGSKHEKYLTYPYHNLGDMFKSRQLYDSALKYYELSYEIDQASNDREGIALNLKAKGEVYALQGSPKIAYAYIKKALAIQQADDDKFQLSSTYLVLSKFHVDALDYKKAEVAAKKALDYAMGLAAKLEIKDAASLLTTIYKKQQDYKKALYYNELHHIYEDSLFSESKGKAIALEQLQQAELENIRLEKDNKSMDSQVFDLQLIIENQTYIMVFVSFGLIFSLIILSVLNNANNDKKTANKQLVKQKAEIEKIIGKLKCLNDNIKSQKTELEESNKIKDKLISIISHDFRSPLNSLEGVLDLMSYGQVSEEEMKVISKELRVKVGITTSLLDNMLNWAKNQMQGISPTKEKFEIKQLAEETIDLVSLQAEKKEISILDNVTDSVTVLADYEMIKLVLRNLLSNAIKFSSRFDTIALRSFINNNMLFLSIEDSGVGMNTEQLQNLFTISTNNTLGTAHEKGTGLGLTLCKDFIEKNHGDIEVSSQEGHGSTFTISIPLINELISNPKEDASVNQY